jgi:shikimate kinase
MITVKEIFETEGEEFFRKKEKEALHNLSHLKKIVIATGGGTPCFHDNMQWMNEHGITIWLDEPVETLVESLKPEKKHRPLLKDLNNAEIKKGLEKILKDRAHFYSQAKYHLKGENISEESFNEIIKNHIHA